jgi:hypothetical protein
MRADFWKKTVGRRQPAGLGIDQQRLVVAALDLPFLDRLRRHPLDAQLHARHVVRRIDHEEQRKGDEIHPDQDGQRVEKAANDVSKHCRDYAKSRCRTGRKEAAMAIIDTNRIRY